MTHQLDVRMKFDKNNLKYLDNSLRQETNNILCSRVMVYVRFKGSPLLEWCKIAIFIAVIISYFLPQTRNLAVHFDLCNWNICIFWFLFEFRMVFVSSVNQALLRKYMTWKHVSTVLLSFSVLIYTKYKFQFKMYNKMLIGQNIQ